MQRMKKIKIWIGLVYLIVLSVSLYFLFSKFSLQQILSYTFVKSTASNLLEIDLDGKIISGDGDINDTGYIIHGAIHKTRADLHCVMHSHSRAGLAVSCLKNGLGICIISEIPIEGVKANTGSI